MSFTLQAPTLMGNGEEYPGLVGAKRPGTFHCSKENNYYSMRTFA